MSLILIDNWSFMNNDSSSIHQTNVKKDIIHHSPPPPLGGGVSDEYYDQGLIIEEKFRTKKHHRWSWCVERICRSEMGCWLSSAEGERWNLIKVGRSSWALQESSFWKSSAQCANTCEEYGSRNCCDGERGEADGAWTNAALNLDEQRWPART